MLTDNASCAFARPLRHVLAVSAMLLLLAPLGAADWYPAMDNDDIPPDFRKFARVAPSGKL